MFYKAIDRSVVKAWVVDFPAGAPRLIRGGERLLGA